MLSNKNVKAILVNIFGGIMKCDTIAAGVVAAAREVRLSVPLVVRMKGTNEDLGKKILKDSGLPIISADNMADAAKKVVAAVKGASGMRKPPLRAVPKPKKKVKAVKKKVTKKKAAKAKPQKKKTAIKSKAKGKKAKKGGKKK
jgi:hypothetical protein